MCAELEAYPVIIHNDEQQSYWSDKRNKGSGIPLGLVCNTMTNRWEWADGSALDYKPPSANAALGGSCKPGCSWEVYNTTGYWQQWTDTGSRNFDIHCIYDLKLPTPSADGCETFEDDSEDGVCYQVGLTAENWQEAQMICRSFGADVASIHNKKENSFVRRLAVSKGAISGLFLGATISGKGNDFGWLDGSSWDYQNFLPGFPVKGLGDCLVMNTEETSGQWVNVDCNTKLSVACMRQQNATYNPPTCSSEPWEEGEIISSPGFPYDASVPCEYVFFVDAGKKVELQIHLLEANTCCDNVIIYDNYFGSTVLANLTGEVKDKIIMTTASNYMRVYWEPNGGVNVRGIMMAYRGV